MKINKPITIMGDTMKRILIKATCLQKKGASPFINAEIMVPDATNHKDLNFLKVNNDIIIGIENDSVYLFVKNEQNVYNLVRKEVIGNHSIKAEYYTEFNFDGCYDFINYLNDTTEQLLKSAKDKFPRGTKINDYGISSFDFSMEIIFKG